MSAISCSAISEYCTPNCATNPYPPFSCLCRSLLETAKPYLMNCIRLPAAQTLLLFGFAIDTDVSISRIVFDGWLGLDFPQPGSGMQLLCRAIELRRRWSSRLYAKLNELKEHGTAATTPGHRDDTLWHDLLDFMSLEVVYSIRRLLPADLKTLYTRCPPTLQFEVNPFAADYALSVNQEKGGFNVCEHVVYGCLAELPWTLAMTAALQQQSWQCTRCDFQLEQFDVPEQLQHRAQCQEQRQKRMRSPEVDHAQAVSSSSLSAGANYHCASCDRHLKLSKIDILRHRRQCEKRD